MADDIGCQAIGFIHQSIIHLSYFIWRWVDLQEIYKKLNPWSKLSIYLLFLLNTSYLDIL